MSCDERGPKVAQGGEKQGTPQRNRYFPGKLLTVADYKAEQRYMIEQRRLVNRAMLGWGVASGLSIEAVGGGLTISPGFALDRRGRELAARTAVELARATDVLWLSNDRAGGVKAGGTPAAGAHLLSAHYAECWVDGVRVREDCGGDGCEWNHVRETVLFSLLPIGAPAPGRPACPQLVLPAVAPEAASDAGGGETPPAPHPVAEDDRGPHETLCNWGRNRPSDDLLCEPPALCLEDGIRVDLGAGVPLARVQIVLNEAGGIASSKVEDACGPRRLLRPNDTLFDLIRGCDLTRIEDVGWRNWHELVDGDIRRGRFRQMFVPPAAPAQPNGQNEEDQVDETVGGAVDTTFWLKFSAPVQVASLTVNAITITLIRSAIIETLGTIVRVPIVGFAVDPKERDDPAGTTRRARPMVSRAFYDGEIQRGRASGFDIPTTVEIQIRGDAILDWAGQAIDANAIGRRLPSGNGSPGGDFVSTFGVRPNGKDLAPYPQAAADLAAGAQAINAAGDRQ